MKIFTTELMGSCSYWNRTVFTPTPHSQMSLTVDIVAAGVHRTTVETTASVTLSFEQIHILCALGFAIRPRPLELSTCKDTVHTTAYSAHGKRMASETDSLVWLKDDVISHEDHSTNTEYQYHVARSDDAVKVSCEHNHAGKRVDLTFVAGMLQSSYDQPAIWMGNDHGDVQMWFRDNQCYRTGNPTLPAHIVNRSNGESCHAHYNSSGRLHRDPVEGPAVYMLKKQDGITTKLAPSYYVEGELFALVPTKKLSELTASTKKLFEVVPPAPSAASMMLPVLPQVPVSTAPIPATPSIPAIPSVSHVSVLPPGLTLPAM